MCTLVASFSGLLVSVLVAPITVERGVRLGFSCFHLSELPLVFIMLIVPRLVGFVDLVDYFRVPTLRRRFQIRIGSEGSNGVPRGTTAA